MSLIVEFRDAQVDHGPGEVLVGAMRDEIAMMHDGLELDADYMPRAGPAELSPPHGAFLVGWLASEPVCCGGVKRLQERAREVATFWGEKRL